MVMELPGEIVFPVWIIIFTRLMRKATGYRLAGINRKSFPAGNRLVLANQPWVSLNCLFWKINKGQTSLLYAELSIGGYPWPNTG